MYAAALSDEVTQLRVKLAEEQARMSVEASNQSEAQRSQATADRARDQASRREAASALMFKVEELDQEGFLARFLAFRQYVEMLLQYVPTKTARSKPWKLTVRRSQLCADACVPWSVTVR